MRKYVQEKMSYIFHWGNIYIPPQIYILVIFIMQTLRKDIRIRENRLL